MCMSLTRARGLCSCSSSTRRTSISSPTTSWTVRLQSRRGRRRRKWGQFELVAAGDPREVNCTNNKSDVISHVADSTLDDVARPAAMDDVLLDNDARPRQPM
uniref:Uncharacterized protein n=1 Tax=Triticum urartu TaxID=4572 RepID=A0A8R7VAN9_TRIUA